MNENTLKKALEAHEVLESANGLMDLITDRGTFYLVRDEDDDVARCPTCIPEHLSYVRINPSLTTPILRALQEAKEEQAQEFEAL